MAKSKKKAKRKTKTKTKKRLDLVPRAAGLKKDSKGKEVAKLKQYLERFGYLNPAPRDFSGLEMPPEPDEAEMQAEPALARLTSDAADTFDQATVEAIQEFQSFNGLPVTGELDHLTRELMLTPRCGVPDSAPAALMAETSGLAEFNAHPNSWDHDNLTYGFVNTGPDLTAAETRQGVEQAFALWAAETPLSFTRVSNADSADIRIRFVTGDHGDGSPFDGAGGTLAHAFYPPPNSGALAGDAHFDEDETWTIQVPTGGDRDFVTVAAHEFGHSLGLRHSSVTGSLMAPFYGGPMRFLHSDDIAGIKSQYGSYSIAQAQWVHGTDINIEFPERLESVRRAGFYTYLHGKNDTENWFHFAVPTPVIVDGQRLRIARAMLRCRTHSTNAIIRHVHIYDGYSRIAAHNDVNLTGNQWFAKFGVAHKPRVFWGLGISVGVRFEGGTAAQRRMDFVSAGFDLIK
jgi:peptidoglycan hydrolase-like protein with peptidoglycan-binding domain